MQSFYRMKLFARLPKENVIQGGGHIWDWGFAIADIYSAKTNVRNRWGCEGPGSMVFRLRGAGMTGEAR